MEFPNPFTLDPIIGFAIPVFFLSIGLELWVRNRQDRPKWDGKDGWASISMGVGAGIINLAVKSTAFLAYYWVYQYRLFDLSDYWWSWILLVFADDLTFYFHHRSCHEIRLFWAAHVNHHSSTNYNLAVALRQSWGELFHKYIWWLWLPCIGFHPVQIVTVMAISLIYQFFLHTETVKKFPRPIEWFFNTPSHHRVHHASNVRYLDRNHAGMLIIWDRLFGTFAPELEEEPVVYGITTNIHTYNPFQIATHEYLNMGKDMGKVKRWRDKLGYLFKPPGWSHDGSTQTADEMRKQAGLK